MAFIHVGPRLTTDEFICDFCGARFLYCCIELPNEPNFVVSDNPPTYCPECGKRPQ